MANESGIMLEFPYTLTGPTGTAYWTGCGRLGNVVRATNAEASTAIAPGDVLSWDISTVMQAPDRATTLEAVRQFANVKLATTTGSLDILCGVAVTPAAVGQEVIIAAGGSLVCAKATANGTRRQNLITSATAGQVTPQDALPAVPASNLGHVVKIRGTTGGATDSGSAAMVLAAVNIS